MNNNIRIFSLLSFIFLLPLLSEAQKSKQDLADL